jgi:glutathione synthase/RimK-type ligase-like ATP-grasp enzyme
MILFFGRHDDTPMARAVEVAVELGVPHVLLDQTQLAYDEAVIHLGSTGLDGWFSVGGQRIPLQTVTAVYSRPLALPVERQGELASIRAQAFNDMMVEWLDVAPCLVINRPEAMDSNASKPYQSQWIARAGFAIPETLITNDPQEVLAFQHQHGRVIYKSLSGVRSIVRELDSTARERLEQIRHLPTQFQAWVPGTDVRVHVVGLRTFAAAVTSEAIDYRYAQRDSLNATLQATTLPEDVADRCIALAAMLKLPLCGIDLRRTPDGSYVCFEVNPMPAYSYYEVETGQPISYALVELMAAA